MRVFLLLWLVVGQAACYHATYSTGARRSTHAPTAKGTNHFFLYGLANSSTVNAAAACGAQGPARVDVHETFVDGLLSALTLGIYTPRTYKVWCAASPEPPVQSLSLRTEVSK